MNLARKSPTSPGSMTRHCLLQLRRPMDDLSRARLLAVEILLAHPEALGNDALEADLYLLRDQLQTPTGT